MLAQLLMLAAYCECAYMSGPLCVCMLTWHHAVDTPGFLVFADCLLVCSCHECFSAAFPCHVPSLSLTRGHCHYRPVLPPTLPVLLVVCSMTSDFCSRSASSMCVRVVCSIDVVMLTDQLAVYVWSLPKPPQGGCWTEVGVLQDVHVCDKAK